MGNKPLSSNPLEKFVLSSSSDDDSTQVVEDKKLLISLYEIYKTFKQNPNAYKEYKAEEEKQSEQSTLIINKEADDSSGGSQRKATKAKTYQLILLNLLMKKYKNEVIYALLFRLIRYLLCEEDFLVLLLKNPTDQISSITLGDEMRITPFLFIEGCELLNELLITLQTHSLLAEKQLQILFKIYLIPMRFDCPEYNSNPKCMRVLCKLFYNCVKLLLVLQERTKFAKSSFIRDYFDFQKNILNDFNSKNLFKAFVHLIDRAKIDTLLEQLMAMQDAKALLEETKEEMSNAMKDDIMNKENTTEDEISKLIKEDIECDYNKESKVQVNDLKETVPFLIMDTLMLLNNIDFIFTEKIIKPDTENEIGLLLRFVFNNMSRIIIESNDDDNTCMSDFEKNFYVKLVQEILSYIISYFTSYCACNNSYQDDSMCLLHPSDKGFPNKIDLLFEIYEKAVNEELKFLVSVLFCAIGINREVFRSLFQRNILNSTTSYIIAYIKAAFNHSNNKLDDVNESNTNNGSGIIDLNKAKEEKRKERLSQINKLVKLISFIAGDERVYGKIKHVAYFGKYFDVVLLLFYINAPCYRVNVLNAMNVFTLYDTCKLIFYERRNKQVQLKLLKHIEDLYVELTSCNALANELLNHKADIMKQIEEGQEEEAKPKLYENSDLNENLLANAKQTFNVIASDFALLISIFVNLMISTHFERNIQILTNNKSNQMFYFNTNYIDMSNEPVNEDTNDDDNDETNVTGVFHKYHSFFRKLKAMKQELAKPLHCNSSKRLAKFVFQIPLAIAIYNPNARMVIQGDNDYGGTYNEDVSGVSNELYGDLFNLNGLLELLQQNRKDNEILHKVLFAINRFCCKRTEMKFIFDALKNIIKEVKTFLVDKNIPLYVSRECFRLLCTLSTRIDSCFLWLKFDSSKLTIDNSNSNDIVLKYMNDDLNWEDKTVKQYQYETETKSVITASIKQSMLEAQGTEDKQIKQLPVNGIQPYNKSMGVFTFDKHFIYLPQPIVLTNDNDSSYTIWFRFYNPVPNNSKWHTLLQDSTGLISIVAIDSSTKRIGSFLNNGDFVDSGIDLSKHNLKHKWLQVAIVFKSFGYEGQSNVIGELKWYLNGEVVKAEMQVMHYVNGKAKRYHSNKYIMANNIQYIGNSRDYNEPFGAFCDVRIYKGCKRDDEIKMMYTSDERNVSNNNRNEILKMLFEELHKECVVFAMNVSYVSEEVLLFLVKFVNSLMSDKRYRWPFTNFAFIMKISNEGYEYTRLEVKKHLVKYLQIVS